jgi:hypothetical protein
MQNFSFKLNLYAEKQEREIVIGGKLHQLKLFGGVNQDKILFRESNGQSELFRGAKWAFPFLKRCPLEIMVHIQAKDQRAQSHLQYKRKTTCYGESAKYCVPICYALQHFNRYPSLYFVFAVLHGYETVP